MLNENAKTGRVGGRKENKYNFSFIPFHTISVKVFAFSDVLYTDVDEKNRNLFDLMKINTKILPNIKKKKGMNK